MNVIKDRNARVLLTKFNNKEKEETVIVDG